jgi:hypothetical protein
MRVTYHINLTHPLNFVSLLINIIIILFYYLAKSKNYGVHYCTFFPMTDTFSLLIQNILPNTLFLHISIYVLFLGRETKFHTH